MKTTERKTEGREARKVQTVTKETPECRPNQTVVADWKPVADPADPSALREEVKRLVAGGRGAVASQGGLEVHLAPAQSIPVIMNEIGRLRELTFREVGEGTGKAVDLDEYDPHYLHLFLWDPEKGKVAGGYRMGRTDMILAEFGSQGLVTASQFEFEQPFLDYLNPGLELGRAFVTSDYQKSMYPLALLWKGIGSFIVRYPRYRKLFGCVSISDDYTRISRDIIVRYMRRSHTNSVLARWVHPNHAYRETPVGMPGGGEVSARLRSIEQVSARIAEAEPDGKGVPVLLRQYLRLNATLVEFCVDPTFNNALDALVLVDLREAPEKMLGRYLGKEGARAVGSQKS